MQTRETTHHEWTSQELMLLGMGLRKHQHDWRRISEEFLPHLNPISIKNKFYKRPAEIADVIAELGLERDQVDRRQPSLEDLREIESRLQKELLDVEECIAKAVRHQSEHQQSPPQPSKEAELSEELHLTTIIPPPLKIQSNLEEAEKQIQEKEPPPRIPTFPPPETEAAEFDEEIMQQIASLRQPNISFPDFSTQAEWGQHDKQRNEEWHAGEKNVVNEGSDLKDEDRIASLLDNYSQQFPGFLSPQNSFEDIHK